MQLEELIRSVLDASEYRIIELVLRGEKRTKVLEVFVDRKEGVNIDELASLSRDIEEKIEQSTFAGELSKIILSSPGAERPFKFIWQLTKHIGRMLEIQLKDGRKIEGKLLAADDVAGEILVSIAPEKKKAEAVEAAFRFEDIESAKVRISFSKK